MSWQTCTICKEAEIISEEESKTPLKKTVNYHESSSTRQFRITISTKCRENQRNDELTESTLKSVNFFVDLLELVAICPYFQKFNRLDFLELSTNCTSTWISAPENMKTDRGDCNHEYSAPMSPLHFHAFLDSVCPSLYGIRPAPLTMDSVIPVLDILSHFHSEPLLTNCERFLMSLDIDQLDGSSLIRLLDKGLCVSLDHRILGRVLCACLTNTATRMSEVAQDLTGTVGSVFAQAFVAHSTRTFRHIMPLHHNSTWPVAIRNLMVPASNTSNEEDTDSEGRRRITKKKNRKRQKCDHTEESFECILCFDQRCGKCKGEAAFCYKALDNFLYEVRLQFYPHTYRAHLDRDLQREDRLSDYIIGRQLDPLPDL